RYEVVAVEDALDQAAVEQGFGEGRRTGALGVGEVARACVHHRLPRKELAGGWVRSLLGADQHGRDVALKPVAIKNQKAARRRPPSGRCRTRQPRKSPRSTIFRAASAGYRGRSR